MDKLLIPLVGYNNNVTHLGRVFHLQTEDSGAKYARIVTHLFADGGRIVSTARTEYHEHLEAGDVATKVRDIMQRQHRAMYAALRSGRLDPMLADLKLGPSSAPAAVGDGEVSRVSSGPAGPSEPLDRLSMIPEPAAPAPPKAKSSRPPRRAPQDSRSEAGARSDAPERRRRTRATPLSFALHPIPKASIFGAVTKDERPLDDAILLYLHADKRQST